MAHSRFAIWKFAIRKVCPTPFALVPQIAFTSRASALLTPLGRLQLAIGVELLLGVLASAFVRTKADSTSRTVQ